MKLKEAFEVIRTQKGHKNYIADICLLISEGKIDRLQINEILEKYSIKSTEVIKELLLDLILSYVRFILIDNMLTENELNNVRLLKLLFGIKEGDFIKCRQEEITEVMRVQLYLIYSDKKIDENEEQHKSMLQRMFDLSYDQFLVFANVEDFRALEKGADFFDLKTFIRPANKRNDVLEREISQSVKDKVWTRDKGKCVICGRNERLEFDHIIPVSKGGSNTYRNIQLLCENCNRTKSDKIGL